MHPQTGPTTPAATRLHPTLPSPPTYALAGKTHFLLKPPSTTSMTSAAGKKHLYDAQGRPIVDLDKKMVSAYWYVVWEAGTKGFDALSRQQNVVMPQCTSVNISVCAARWICALHLLPH
jgi:hypothetical protein